MLVALAVGLIASLPLALVPAAPASAAAAFTPPPDNFVGVNQVTLSGTKGEGSTLVIRRTGASGIACSINDPSGTTWSCPSLPVPNGQVEFTGVETLDDGSTEPMAPLRLVVVGPPRLDGAPGSTLTSGRVTGTGEPGAALRVLSDGPGGARQHSCPGVLGDGFWSCIIDVPSGTHSVQAIQSLPTLSSRFSSPSATLTATVDRDPPAAPTVISPDDGDVVQRPSVIVSGVGEAGASIQVFVNGEQRCVLPAGQDGSWSCSVDLRSPGSWTIQVLQRDAAGNFSAPSERVVVTYEPPTESAPSPSPTAPAPGSPPPSETSPPAPGQTPEEEDDPPTLPEDESATPLPPSPTPPSPAPPVRPDGPAPSVDTSNWGTLTGFGGSLPTAAQILDRGGWLLAPIVGIGYLLFIALPVRAIVRSSLPRLLPPAWRLTGRNRGADALHESDAPLLPGWVVAVGVFAGAALVAALSGGIALEVRYLRLMAAIGLGLVLLNGLAVVLPARLAGRRHGVAVSERLLPAMFIGAVFTALLSRVWELQPPVLIGVLVATTFSAIVPRAARAAVAIAQTSGVAVLALAAWAAHDLLTPATGFWANFAAEIAAAIALGGLGSLLLLLLPVGAFPGRALYTVSRAGWSVITVLTAAVGGAIAFSGPNFPLLPLALGAAAFAAACSAIFVWTRWVEPTLR